MFKVDLNDVVTNAKTGEEATIVIKRLLPCKWYDLLIGTVVIIGGVAYVSYKSFKSGCEAYREEEFNALDKLGLLFDNTEENVGTYLR